MAKFKTGKVISDKMQKTVTVKVSYRLKHPFYKKLITRSKNFKAHDELGAKIGQAVNIIETKPYSKEVKFKVLEVIKNA